MSVFGTREDDPLLQDDPLAPPVDEETEDEASDESTAEEYESPDDLPPEGAKASAESLKDDPPSTATPDRAGDSVFQATTFNAEQDARVVVRSAEEAAEGRLSVLNAALDEEWSLERVEVREPDPTVINAGDDEALSSKASMVLAFVLQREESE